MDEMTVLKLSIHGRLVGFLAGFKNGKNILSFADEFRGDSARPTFSLITHPDFPNSTKLMSQPWAKHQRLHPVLSNLLPEGALRELITQGLKTHIDNEFQIFSYLGQDLPGAIIAIPLAPEEVPTSLLASYGQAKAVKFENANPENRFSLAGVQMKFSMKEKDGRYNLTKANQPDTELGDWIIKTPSTRHSNVPVNEYTAMSLAKMVGIDIPEIRLVELEQLENLPPINLPDEKLAFAIKRFDRTEASTPAAFPSRLERVHMEDFAQILVKYPHEKYNTANYEQIGQVIYRFSGDGLADAQQFTRRLLVNILLANGDAHLKNWSFLYRDQITPRLSPAYDIVTTSVYIDGEKQFALNLGKNKAWHDAKLLHFEDWAEKSGIPWRAIKPHLADTMDKARALWPSALNDSPMADEHKEKLKAHWNALQPEFRIYNGHSFVL